MSAGNLYETEPLWLLQVGEGERVLWVVSSATALVRSYPCLTMYSTCIPPVEWNITCASVVLSTSCSTGAQHSCAVREGRCSL